MHRRTTALLAAPLLLLAGACASGQAPSDQSPSADAPSLTVTHLATIPLMDGIAPFDMPLGGLSGIDYDPATGSYLAISDDRAEHGPARAYTFTLDHDVADGATSAYTEFTGITLLLDADGQPYPVKGVAPESIRHVPGSADFIYASEGDASNKIAPFIRRADADGGLLVDYPLPAHYLPAFDPDGEQTSGLRYNLGFEGLTFSPDGSRILALTENSLLQDGPIPTAETGSDARLLVLDAESGDVVDEFVYPVSPLSAEHPDVVDPTGWTLTADRGASEILAIDEDEFLVIERGLVPGKGNEVQIFWTTTAGATSVSGQTTLDGAETPMPKRLLFDFADTGANPDNVEGITWGPTLQDGTRTLVLASDDNFNSAGGQRTLLHVLAVR